MLSLHTVVSSARPDNNIINLRRTLSPNLNIKDYNICNMKFAT